MDAKNYRPLLITCAFSKMFEKILHAQITEHLDKFQIMTPFQFGFRKHFNTCSCLCDKVIKIKKIQKKSYMQLD